MKLAGTVLLAALSIGTAHASGYVGIYAAIDKVVFEPDADHPQRVQVFGVFSVAQPGKLLQASERSSGIGSGIEGMVRLQSQGWIG
jgi:hypothetical protein